jgi:hypothetical protein
MTDRATFLATVRATPRGTDPGLPDRTAAPPAPTELRACEDPVDRFQREAELVSMSVLRVSPRRRISPATYQPSSQRARRRGLRPRPTPTSHRIARGPVRSTRR